MDPNDVRALLDRVELFHGLDAAALDRVAALAEQRSLPTGAVLLRQGDSPDHLFLVAGGRLKVGPFAPDGTQLTLRLMAQGDLVGCVAVLRKFPYPATAVAVEDSAVLSWTADQVFELVQRHPVIAVNALGIVGDRAREMVQRLTELASRSAEQRIARGLLRAVAHAGQPADTGGEIRLVISRRDLAELTSTSLYTVSRTLSAWERKGIVKGGRQRVLVRDAERLRRLTEGS